MAVVEIAKLSIGAKRFIFALSCVSACSAWDLVSSFRKERNFNSPRKSINPQYEKRMSLLANRGIILVALGEKYENGIVVKIHY